MLGNEYYYEEPDIKDYDCACRDDDFIMLDDDSECIDDDWNCYETDTDGLTDEELAQYKQEEKELNMLYKNLEKGLGLSRFRRWKNPVEGFHILSEVFVERCKKGR